MIFAIMLRWYQVCLKDKKHFLENPDKTYINFKVAALNFT